MKKPPRISEEDQKLFRDTVQGVKPLKKSEKIVVTEKPKITTTPLGKEKPIPPHKIQLVDGPETSYQASDYLSFARSGLQQKRLHQLARGKFPSEAKLDLHGKTSDQAKLMLEEFLTTCFAQHCRVVRVIHGKGQHQKSSQAILKNKVYGWLMECNEVLAFCSCQPRDGGTGALYVLLKVNHEIAFP